MTLMKTRNDADSKQSDDAFLAAQWLIVIGGFIAALIFS